MSRTIIASAITACAHLAAASEHETPVQIATPAPDKSQYTLFNPTPVDLRRPYNTDRPSKTDSPFTIDAGVFQIESDVANWTLDYENGVRTRTWITGNINFKLGLTNWMDLQVFPQFYVNTRTSGPGFGKPVEHDGFGDTTVQLKINLLGNDGGKLVIGFLSSLKISTNTGDTGNHVWEPGFCLLAALGFHAVRANEDRHCRQISQQQHAGAVAKSNRTVLHNRWESKRLC